MKAQRSKMKMTMQNAKWTMLLLCALCLVPSAFVRAHEVYVLPIETIAQAVASESPNPFTAYAGNEQSFYLWGVIAIIVTLTIFFASTFRAVEARAMPLFARLKRYAHLLVRLTIGASLIVFAATASLYGQELPFPMLFGSLVPIMHVLTLLLGVGIIVGFQTRVAALLALALYVYAAMRIDLYALTYLQHAAAYVFLVIAGGGPFTIDHRFHLGWHARKRLERYLPYAFPILRVGLGASIMFAAFYAKFLHTNLALAVVERYPISSILPFDPLFIVLGAFIIEFLAGLMLALGIEIRWTVLFLVFWLTLAHFTLPEAPWVHLSLYGIGLAIFCHGYDRFTIEGRFFKSRGMEPML
jgi:uncharacterized membrane protein YphA (DoxX/SURF4 family)